MISAACVLLLFFLTSPAAGGPRRPVHGADRRRGHQRRHVPRHLRPQRPGHPHRAGLRSAGKTGAGRLDRPRHQTVNTGDQKPRVLCSLFQSNEPNETMPISAFAQKHRAARYLQNLMTPPRGPYPSATTPVLMVGERQLYIDACVHLVTLSDWATMHTHQLWPICW